MSKSKEGKVDDNVNKRISSCVWTTQNLAKRPTFLPINHMVSALNKLACLIIIIPLVLSSTLELGPCLCIWGIGISVVADGVWIPCSLGAEKARDIVRKVGVLMSNHIILLPLVDPLKSIQNLDFFLKHAYIHAALWLSYTWEKGGL